MSPDWRTTTIREVTQQTETWNPAGQPRATIRYVDVSAVSRETMTIMSDTEYPAVRAPSRARKIIQAGDTIFATIRPSLKRIAQVPQCLNNEIASTAFCVLRPSRGLVDPDFLFFAISTDAVVNAITRLETGASYPAVRDSDVLDQLMSLPPLPEQVEIAGALTLIRRALLRQSNWIERGQSLKRAAMRELFTRGLHGEVPKETEIGLAPASWDLLPVFEAVQPLRFERAKQIQTTEYRPTGRWPIVDQGQPAIAGFTDDAKRIIAVGAPVIIFGDHTRVLKYVDFEFALGADGTKPLLASEGFLPRFLFYALSNIDVPSRGYNRHYKVLTQKLVPKPSEEEQREIASILYTIDRKIDLHKRKRAVLEELFKTLLHNLMTGDIRVADLDLSALVGASERAEAAA